VSERKSTLLRLDPAVHDALARWAADELRITNAQIEYLLRRALVDAGGCQGMPDRYGPAGGRGAAARPKPPGPRGTMTGPADTAAAWPEQAPRPPPPAPELPEMYPAAIGRSRAAEKDRTAGLCAFLLSFFITQRDADRQLGAA